MILVSCGRCEYSIPTGFVFIVNFSWKINGFTGNRTTVERGRRKHYTTELSYNVSTMWNYIYKFLNIQIMKNWSISITFTMISKFETVEWIFECWTFYRIFEYWQVYNGNYCIKWRCTKHGRMAAGVWALLTFTWWLLLPPTPFWQAPVLRAIRSKC